MKRGEIPHLNQVARIILRPGQIATENYHDDMSEIFYITSGTGTFRYDGKERAIKVTHPKPQHLVFMPVNMTCLSVYALCRPGIPFAPCHRTGTRSPTRTKATRTWSCWCAPPRHIPNPRSTVTCSSSRAQVIAAAHDCPSISKARSAQFVRKT